MSKVLMIRHLPETLSFQDKEQLLKHFGAETIWEARSKRNYLFASFSSVEKAKASLVRLHQLEIAHRRLVVEFSTDKEPITDKKPESDQNSQTTKLLKEFLKALNAWNPSVDFYQPPPPHLNYKYPDITPQIAINIIHALFTHKPFYTQALHLMNKMCLDVPFEENQKCLEFFKETFREYFVGDIQLPPPSVSETESEISSAEDDGGVEPKVQPLRKLVTRKRKLPVPKHNPKKLQTLLPAAKIKKSIVSQEEIFEAVSTILEPKKIMLNVHQDALQKPTEEPEIIGEIGKFQKEEQPAEVEETPVAPEQPIITRKELLRNRISYKDMKVLPVFKNYHPGQPSMRLYIKNLAKSVTEQDVTSIYKQYVKGLTDEELTGFDVRVMQEGRMKGQAFVTFPTVRTAETALNETNGYLLKEKPMVVQFARAANKKTIE
ncbi:RNA-binding region-containing protein 3-like [Trichoplusia ni]|uniref:RNA-binding region-containing protein 3 n=1 Tax=Trichoplusia ni TaxID=7111 RepID=A0A7E5VYK4_TRINI|nr:RNA-binding region-containing protein 3-like [Trichoplusia ni]